MIIRARGLVLLAVCLLASSGLAAEARIRQSQLADFTGRWQGESKNKTIVNVTLTLDAEGAGSIRYRVIKGGEGEGDRDANQKVVLKEQDGDFTIEFEKTTWTVHIEKDESSLTLRPKAGDDSIMLTKKSITRS